MSADQAPTEAPPLAPRGYFDQEPAQPAPAATPLVSKSGEQPQKFLPAVTPYAGLPAELFEDRAIIALALRLEGYSYDEIAEKTKLSKDQIRYALRKARISGKLNDTIDLIDNEAVPQALENLRAALIDPQHAKHWEATTETLHGRGVFRRFNNSKVDGTAGEGRLPPLQIAIINPGGSQLPSVIVNSEKGSVIGSPRIIDAEG